MYLIFQYHAYFIFVEFTFDISKQNGSNQEFIIYTFVEDMIFFINFDSIFKNILIFDTYITVILL